MVLAATTLCRRETDDGLDDGGAWIDQPPVDPPPESAGPAAGGAPIHSLTDHGRPPREPIAELERSGYELATCLRSDDRCLVGTTSASLGTPRD